MSELSGLVAATRLFWEWMHSLSQNQHCQTSEGLHLKVCNSDVKRGQNLEAETEAKARALRLRTRPRLWGQDRGQGQFLEVEAKAKAKAKDKVMNKKYHVITESIQVNSYNRDKNNTL